MRRVIQIVCLLPALGVCFFLTESPVHADDIYAASFYNNTIYRYTSSGQQSVFVNSGLDGPDGLAFDSSGNLYVANWGYSTFDIFSGGSIDKIDSSGHLTVFASGLAIPDGLAFDSSGNLYAAMNTTGTIMKYDPSGNGTVFASGLSFPYKMAFDNNGNLYVVDAGDNSIVKFDPDGNESVFASGITYPRGVALDSNGNVYVSDNNRHIWKFDPSGQGSLFATDLYAPMGLAFDSSGNLFLASSGDNTIVKFDPSGQQSVFANSGLDSPQAVAVQSVPEPATWILLALGIIAFLGNHRLRRHSA
ncbi:MAG TPA: SBBP repeat-containing protein [Verrucomicrobiae bacterium]|nr:SBBP repeat-containing protein [Verrucomicrobiae bacterium]